MSDSIFDFTKAHEQIVFTLRFERPLECMAVCDHLYKCGLVWDDDFGYMPRQDKVEPWQESAICYAEFLDLNFFGYSETRSTCSGLQFKYLFSALPPNCQKVFLDLLEQAQAAFGGQIEYFGKVLLREQLSEFFQQCTLDLQQEFAETAGSEFLQRMLLEFQYNQKAF